MAQRRSLSVDLESTRYYHCITRCVRRAYLCGEDAVTGKSFEHRREWIEKRIVRLSGIFAVDVYAYAVMSNHLHVVVRVDEERAAGWDDDEVVRRFGGLFRLAKKELDAMAPAAKKARIAEWRERLGSLSWMMRALNEWIARKANKEDGCKGRFWEGRFTSQPLLDEQALVTCMAYVDLNPVRAGMTKTLEGSAHTSIRARLEEAASFLDVHADDDDARARRATPRAAREAFEEARTRRTKAQLVPEGLAPFADQVPKYEAEVVLGHISDVASDERDPGRPLAAPMNFIDYLELVEWAGRCVREKGGVTQGQLSHTPVLLTRLQMDPRGWLRAMTRHGLSHVGVLGSIEHVQAHAERQGKAWVRGVGHARRVAA